MTRPTNPHHDSDRGDTSRDDAPSRSGSGGGAHRADPARPNPEDKPGQSLATGREAFAAHGGVAGSEALIEHIRGLEQELRRLEADLDHSRRLATLGGLSAAVAHELNNALTPMTSYAQLALDDPGDTALTRKALNCVVEGVERASRMARSMLGLVCDGDAAASAESRGEDKPQGGCALRGVVDAAMDCLVGQPGRARVRVEVEVPDLVVRMPRADLQQVLVNLLLNAHRAVLSGRGTGRVTVGAERVGQGGRGERVQEQSVGDGQSEQDGDGTASRVALWVADNGPGVPEGVRDRLFEAFVTCPLGESAAATGGKTPAGGQAEEGNTTHGGTGLGLSICRDLVERAGGTIGVEDGPGEKGGAVFRVVLPGVKTD